LRLNSQKEPVMKKSAWLAAVAAVLASSPCFAQFGGMGGMGGGIGGGMGGQGMQGNMMQATHSAQAFSTGVPRSAHVEMEGGQVLSGKIETRPVIVDADLGQYVITPHKIKMIRFLKPVEEARPPGGDEAFRKNNAEAGAADEADLLREVPKKRAAMVRAARGGFGGAVAAFAMVADPGSRTGTAMLVRGKVITTADQEVIGMIHIPGDFTLELDFGSLILAPTKLRSITFTDKDRKDRSAQAAPVTPGAHENEKAGRPALAHDTRPPRYFRQGKSIIVISPVGDRITLHDVDTKKSASLELSGSTEAPLEVTPVTVGDLIALMVKGPKITRIAVANTASGTWRSQDLREPIDGEAVPIVAPGVAVYAVGRNVYAYGAESDRWDVAELPEGVRAAPVVSPGAVTIETDGHIYAFSAKTGKWNHTDVRAILDDAGAKQK
jgi:hypothetical protein